MDNQTELGDLNLAGIKEAAVDNGESAPVIQHLSEEAKSGVGGFTLPTGYLDESGTLHTSVVLKEITGNEEDILTSTKMPVQMRMNRLLENCTLSIGTHNQGSVDWSRIIKSLTAGDRLFVIMKIRIVSLGSMFSFKVKCPGDNCGKFSNQTVSLEDFVVHGLEKPLQRTWKGTLPRSKWTYQARVQTGFEEEVLSKVKDNNDLMTMSIAARLVELNGHMPVNLAELKGLGTMDRQYLRDDFQAHEGRIENEAEVTCPHCGHEFSVGIDIGEPSFFFPSSMRKS